MVLTVEEILEESKQKAKGVSFDEALKASQFGKFHYFLIFFSGAFMASSFFETMGINYALPVAECDLKISSKQQYGIISGVWFAGIIVTSHLWGFLSDTYGRRKILIIASLSAFLASALSSLAVNLWQLAIFRLLNGCFISGLSSTIFAYLGEFLGSKNRSRSMMIASVLYAAFCMFLPIMAWLVINQTWSFVIPFISVTYKPWRLFLLACGFPSLMSGLAIIFFPESPKFTFSQGDEVKTLEIFRKIYRFNTGSYNFDVYRINPNEEFGKAREKKNVLKMMLEQTVSLIRDYPRSILVISGIQFGILFVSNGMLLFFPNILHQTATFQATVEYEAAGLCFIVENAIEKNQSNLDDPVCINELDISAYYYAIILETCYFVGFLVVSLLVNYIGRLSIFSFIFFTTGLCGFLIVFVKSPVIATYLYVWLLVSGVNNNLLNTVTYELFPTNLRSLALSLSLMVGRLGSLVGGNVVGFMLENNCTPTFILSGVIMVICGLLSFAIPNIMKRK